MKKTTIVIGLALLSTTLAAQIKLTPKNIDKVIKEMTIEEKANMLVGYSFGKSYWGLPTNPDPNAGAIVLGAAGNTAKIDRLGIPHTVLADGPAGSMYLLNAQVTLINIIAQAFLLVRYYHLHGMLI